MLTFGTLCLIALCLHHQLIAAIKNFHPLYETVLRDQSTGLWPTNDWRWWCWHLHSWVV